MNTLLYINLSHFIFEKGDVCCVWEMSGDKDGLLYWPKFFLAHDTGGPKPSVCCWFSQRHHVSNGLKPSRHPVVLFSNTHLLPLFFCLFTQVHLLIDSSIEGQYITIIPFFIYIYIYINNILGKGMNPTILLLAMDKILW